jgi:hypothetical protein
MTAEAVEAPAIGQLLVASSCTDGEKVVRGGSRLQSKTRWRGDAGKAAARWPYRRRSGARPGGEALSDSGDDGARTRTVERRSDSEAAAWLRTMASVLQTATRSAGAFMVWARHVAVSARHGERESDRWDPAADFISN